MAKGTESTNGRLWDMRPIIFYNMVQRGYVPVRAHETWGEAHGATNVLIFIDHVDDAVQLRGLLRALETRFAHAVRPLLVLSGGPGEGRLEKDVVPTLGREHKPHICCIIGLWDMYLRKLDSQPFRASDVFAESLLAARGIMETTRPALVVVPHRRGSPVARGVAEAAAQLHVPVAALVLPDLGAGERAVYGAPDGAWHVNAGWGGLPFATPAWEAASKAADEEAAVVLAEALAGVFSGALGDATPHATQPVAGGAGAATPAVGTFAAGAAARARALGDELSPTDAPVLGAYAYASSSAGLLLNYVEALLCACERLNSQGVGGFAVCPWRKA